MYYKVTDQESEAWKKIHAFTELILEQRNANGAEASKFIGIPFEEYVKETSLFNLTGTIRSIKPLNKELVKNHYWKKDEKNSGFYKPNLETNQGRIYHHFFKKQLGYSCYDQNLIFEVETEDRFIFFATNFRDTCFIIKTLDDIKFRRLIGMEEIGESEYYQLMQS